jgi:predicted transcriptional regulator
MSDDLLHRLDEAANDTRYIDHQTASEAAARIRELEAQLADGSFYDEDWIITSTRALRRTPHDR